MSTEFPDHSVYIRLTEWQASYCGSCWPMSLNVTNKTRIRVPINESEIEGIFYRYYNSNPVNIMHTCILHEFEGDTPEYVPRGDRRAMGSVISPEAQCHRAVTTTA